MRRDLKILADARNLLVAEKERSTVAFKEQIGELEKSLRAKESALEAKDSEYEKLDRMYRQAAEEREKMRERIAKIRMKKVVNPNQKQCKNCCREYLETENFNWSCRTHRVTLWPSTW